MYESSRRRGKMVKNYTSSAKFWGRMSAKVVRDLIKTDGIKNTWKHNLILFHQAIWYGKHLIGNSFVLQHGCDPNKLPMQQKAYFDRKKYSKNNTVLQWNTTSHVFVPLEPKPQRYWSGGESFWHIIEQKAEDYPKKSFEMVFKKHKENFLRSM